MYTEPETVYLLKKEELAAKRFEEKLEVYPYRFLDNLIIRVLPKNAENLVLARLKYSKELGSTAPLCLRLGPVVLTYWFNLNAAQDFWEIQRNGFHFNFEIGPVTVGW